MKSSRVKEKIDISIMPYFTLKQKVLNFASLIPNFKSGDCECQGCGHRCGRLLSIHSDFSFTATKL